MKTQSISKTLKDFYKNKIKNPQYIFGGDGDGDGGIDRNKIGDPPPNG